MTGRASTIGRLEWAFAVAATLLTTDAILTLLRLGPPVTIHSVTTNVAVDSGGDPVKQAIFLAIYGVSTILLLLRAGVVRPLRCGALAWVVVAVAAASIFWSVDPALTARRVVAFTGTTVFGVYLGITFPGRQLVWLLVATMSAAIAASLLFVVARPDLAFQYDGRGVAWNGAFRHKNTLGQHMALAIPLGLIGLTMSTTRARRIALWLLIVAASALLLLSESKTAIVTCAAMLGCFALCALVARLRRRSPTLLLGVSAVILAGIATLAVLAASFFTTLTALVGRDATLTGRTYIWEAVIDSVADQPWLGYGYSAFWGGLDSPASEVWAQTSSLLFGLQVSHAHNGWLDLWLELGLVGVVAFAYLVIRLLTWVTPSATSGQRDPAMQFAFIFLVLLLIANVVESRTVEQNSFTWAVLCALVTHRGVSRATRPHRSQQVTSSGPARTRDTADRAVRPGLPIRTTSV